MDIKTICLAILAEGDSSGYQIQKFIKEGCIHYFFGASFGSLYPALARLTDEGMITCRIVAQSRRPEKKVYSITPAGRLALSKALATAPTEDRMRSPFMAALLFSHLLSPHDLYRLLEDRRAYHQRAIEELETEREASISPGQRFVQEYAHAINQAALDYLEANRTDLEGHLLLANATSRLEGQGR